MPALLGCRPQGVRRRAPWVYLLAIALPAIVSLASPSAALAHAVLLRSSPAPNGRLAAPPIEIDLFFSEALNQHYSTVQVRDATNAPAGGHAVHFGADPTEMALSLTPLSPGFYSVNWTTVSKVDGHRLQGSFPFTILNADGSLPAGAPATTHATITDEGGSSLGDDAFRLLLIVSIVLGAGGYLFAGFLAGPAAVPGDEWAAAARRWTLTVAGRTAAAAGAAATLVNLEILARQADLVGGPKQLGRLLSSRAGLYWGVREVAALLICAGGAALLAGGMHERRRLVTIVCWVGVGLFAVEAATLALTGHAAAGGGAGWAVPSDVVHIFAVGLWLGPLALLPPLLLRPPLLGPEANTAFRARVLSRFSFLASIAVGTVVATGLFNAAVEVGSLHYLATTTYGRTLSLKSVLILPLFGLGAWNSLRMVRRSSLAGPRESSAAARLLGRLAGMEALIATLVLAVTAALVLMVPSKDEAAQRQVRPQPSAATASVFRNTVPAGDLQATLVVSPNLPGENDLTVTLNGPGVGQVLRVQLRFQGPDPGAGGSSVDAAPVGPGQYEAQAANLTFAGLWRVAVNVQRTGFDDVNGNFDVSVPGAAAGAGPTRAGLWDFPAAGITANQAIGLLLAGAALLLLRVRARLRFGRWAARASRLFVGVALFLGAMLFFAVHTHQGSGSAQALNNPVPADQRSVDDGFTLYQANCAVCHGSTGRGDGPAAAHLNPRPLDLTVHVGLHPDWQLYDWITNGLPPSAMPAWKAKLDDQQRWDLINYLRTLAAVTGAPHEAVPAGKLLRAP